MPLEEATDADMEVMVKRASRLLTHAWAQEPAIAASDVVETLAMALRLVYQEALPEFKREMLKYLAANLAEMQEADA